MIYRPTAQSNRSQNIYYVFLYMYKYPQTVKTKTFLAFACQIYGKNNFGCHFCIGGHCTGLTMFILASQWIVVFFIFH